MKFRLNIISLHYFKQFITGVTLKNFMPHRYFVINCLGRRELVGTGSLGELQFGLALDGVLNNESAC